jgi:thiol-disulfide isomerase/thioredoxin
MSTTTTEQKYVCPHCHYSTIVAGKRYYEAELELYLETRKCKSCKCLFDTVVTKKVTDEARKIQLDKFNKDYPENIQIPFSETLEAYGQHMANVVCLERKKITCTKCGSDKNEKWSEHIPVCPKCNNDMYVGDYKFKEDKSCSEFLNFSELINSAPKVVLCFVFPECCFCRHARNMVAEILSEKPFEFRFIEISVEFAEMNDLIYKYKLKAVPTFLLFHNGKFAGKFRKILSKVDLEVKILKRYDIMLNR